VIRRTGAGTLRDLISVERRTTVKNGRGGTADSWVATITDLPASIVAQRGGEAVQSQRLAGSTPVDIMVRHSALTASIQPSDRVTDANGAIYAVKWVGSLDEGRPRWIMLSCTTGTGADR
jgi:head-tail adaptor